MNRPTIFPTSKPLFERQGSFSLPDDMKFAGEVEPELRPREWLTLIWLMTDKNHLTDKQRYEEFELFFCGSRITKWRTVKKLKEKGYLSPDWRPPRKPWRKGN